MYYGNSTLGYDYEEPDRWQPEIGDIVDTEQGRGVIVEIEEMDHDAPAYRVELCDKTKVWMLDIDMTFVGDEEPINIDIDPYDPDTWPF